MVIKKNIVLIGFLMLCVNITAFSFESRLSFGFEFGNTFETRTDRGIDIETYMGSPGVDLSGYYFWDNIGFFINNSFLFPNIVKTNIDVYDYFFQYNFIIGPAFKIRFNEKTDMTLGLGFSLGPTIGENNNISMSLFNLGIAGDIGLNYFINKIVYISIGSIFSYHFFNVTKTDTGEYILDGDGDREYNYDIKRSKSYNSVGIRPYIKIGWRIKKYK